MHIIGSRTGRWLSGFAKSNLPVLAVAGVGILSPLHYINRNFDDLSAGDAIVLLAAGIIASLLIYAASNLLLRNRSRAAIPAAAALYLAFNYEGIHNVIGSAITVGWVVIAAVAVLAHRMRAHRVKTIESMLLITVSLFIGMYCVFLAEHVARSWRFRVTVANEDLVQAVQEARATGKPDIYYIMPDDYAGNIALGETYGFDNRRFTDALEQLGYYVPAQSFSNYPITTTSLASSINAGLLRSDAGNRQTTSLAPFYALIQKPEVARFLQAEGYTFIQLGSWWQPTQRSRYAHRVLQYGYSLTLFGAMFPVSQFTGRFVSRTVLRPWLEQSISCAGIVVAKWQDVHEDQIFQQQMQDLRHIMAEEGPPRFVFAHLLMPHLPVVFDTDGGPIAKGLSAEEAYTHQVQFTNQKLIELVRDIQFSERGRNAIVVVASDEGQFPTNDTISASDKQLRHKSNTFAAIYFPDHDYSRLYSTITPVNYFRVIFNKYFGTTLTLQPDIVYAYRTSRVFILDLADVTARVHNAFPPNLPGGQ